MISNINENLNKNDKLSKEIPIVTNVSQYDSLDKLLTSRMIEESPLLASPTKEKFAIHRTHKK